VFFFFFVFLDFIHLKEICSLHYTKLVLMTETILDKY